jgi:hypothetical protein
MKKWVSCKNKGSWGKSMVKSRNQKKILSGAADFTKEGEFLFTSD